MDNEAAKMRTESRARAGPEKMHRAAAKIDTSRKGNRKTYSFRLIVAMRGRFVSVFALNKSGLLLFSARPAQSSGGHDERVVQVIFS